MDFLRASSYYDVRHVRADPATALIGRRSLSARRAIWSLSRSTCSAASATTSKPSRSSSTDSATFDACVELDCWSGNAPQAIDFAREQQDDELWEDLLARSETRPGP